MSKQAKRRGNPSWRAGGPSPNPKGRPAVARNDGLVDILAGAGTSRDKRQQATTVVPVLDSSEMRRIWRSDDMAARAVEVVPNEMFREGVRLQLTDKNKANEVEAEFKRLRFRQKYRLAKKYERAYGGAALWPIINDGSKSLAVPLQEKRITRITCLRVLEPRELIPCTWDEDINSESYNEPLTYTYMPAGGRGRGRVEIHRSRLILFEGKRVTTDATENAENFGHGDSIFLSMSEVLRDFKIGWATAAVLLVDFAQGVYKMKGLAGMLAKDRGALVKARIQTMDLSKSVFRALVIDADDDYQRQQTPLTNLPEMLDRFASRLSAAARLPVTVLMGQSPKGLGNEGDSDVRFLYDQVAGEQEETIPQLNRGAELVMLQHDGPMKGKLPKDTWSMEFCSLWQPSDKEKAETRLINAQTDVLNIERGVYTAQTVREQRYGGDVYGTEIKIDVEADRALEQAQQRAAATAATAGDLDLRSTLSGPVGAQPANANAVKPVDTAMNGAQVTALLEVIKSFNRGEVSGPSAIQTLVRAFGVSPSDAGGMIDESFAVKFQATQAQQAAAQAQAQAQAQRPVQATAA